MKWTISPAFNKRSLASHSWLGVLLGVLMYWICLSGTVAVFGQEFMRWEQPEVRESLDYEPAALQSAYQQLVQQEQSFEGLVTLRLPTPDLPRAFISANDKAWYITEDGRLGQPKQHGFTDMIAELHAELHLPHSFGMIVVSVLGALLTALIISGVFAHRRIFKDAFRWRRGGNSQLAEADLHNRLSVWGLPFHLMIALTGAYFGLALLLASFYSKTLYDNNQMALFADVFGGTPEVQSYNGQMDLDNAFQQLQQIAPDTQPVFITFERAGQDDQFLLMGSQHMDKLIYTEQYRFDAMGNYIDAVGYADGKAGQEAIFSVYRLHFGHYGGEWMKLVYGLLGLALTVISVSGINLWLKKRAHQDALNDYWAGIVWGTPAAMVLAAMVSLVFSVSVVMLFWLPLIAATLYAVLRKRPKQVSRQLLALTSFGLVALVILHIVLHPSVAMAPMMLWVNGGLLLTGVLLVAHWRKSINP